MNFDKAVEFGAKNFYLLLEALDICGTTTNWTLLGSEILTRTERFLMAKVIAGPVIAKIGPCASTFARETIPAIYRPFSRGAKRNLAGLTTLAAGRLEHLLEAVIIKTRLKASAATAPIVAAETLAESSRFLEIIHKLLM